LHSAVLEEYSSAGKVQSFKKKKLRKVLALRPLLERLRFATDCQKKSSEDLRCEMVVMNNGQADTRVSIGSKLGML
jgi:hypothetical protein